MSTTPVAHGVAQSMSTDAALYKRVPSPSIVPTEGHTYRVHLSSGDRTSGTVQRAQYMVDLKAPNNVIPPGRSSLHVESFNFCNRLAALPPGTSYSVRLEELADFKSYDSGTGGFSTTIHSGTIPYTVDTAARAYPPKALTGDTTAVAGTSFGLGTYVSSASAGFCNAAYLAFDRNAATSATTATGTYVGDYMGSVSTTYGGSNTVLGEWIQVRLPVPIKLTSHTIQMIHGERAPENWMILGSLDGVTWDLVHQPPPIVVYAWFASTNNTLTFNTSPTSTKAYSFYRMAITKKTGTGQTTWSYIQLASVEFTGVRDHSSEPYPIAALTAPTTALSDGSYVASASAGFATAAHLAFDDNAATSANTSPGLFAMGGAYLGSVSTPHDVSNSSSGEWLQVRLPFPIKLSNYTVQVVHGERAPYSWVLLGSIDGINWTSVDSEWGFSSYYWNDNNLVKTYEPFVARKPYSYYRVVTLSKSGTGQGVWNYIEIVKWELRGTRVYGSEPSSAMMATYAPISEGVAVPTRDFLNSRQLTVVIDSPAGTTTPLDDYDMVLAIEPMD